MSVPQVYRDVERIRTTFSDVIYHAQWLSYIIDPEFPGLTPEEKEYLEALQAQLGVIISKARKLVK
jgi:hypothetical protein